MVTSTARQPALFEGIKERVQCPKCGGHSARFRKKVRNWLCLRCGTVWDQLPHAKERL
jgi:ribosomal protein L37AE/L43A